MKPCVVALGIISLAVSASACIWVTGTTLDGGSVSSSGMSGARLLRSAIEMNRNPDGAQMEANLRGATNINDRSDYAVALMYLGRSSEAVEILERLEQQQPGEYFIAANLGTAYELAGRNAEALRWINEGIRRNPDSHNGTEWLHTKILEAKIAQQKDADYFKNHSVLELQPEKIRDGIIIEQKKIEPKELARAIEYQLAERLQFVKPPDPAVASLIFDYAAIEAASKTLESTKPVLQMALEYGYPTNKVAEQLKIYDRRIAWRKTKQYTFYCLIGLGAVGLLYLLYRRGIFVISSRDLKRTH